MIDCRQTKVVGYENGQPVDLTVVTVDNKPVELRTANAFAQMARAAAKEGVQIKVVSGFRTMAEQEYFFGCYQTGTCNNGNPAEPPGFSKHQSGRALDLNTKATGVGAWMQAHAGEWGFVRAAAGTAGADEPWHWEWTGGGPPAPACIDQADPPRVDLVSVTVGVLVGLALWAMWR